MGGGVVGPAGLDDFGFGFLGLVLQVVLLVALAHVDDHAGGGGRGRVQLVLLSWGKHK